MLRHLISLALAALVMPAAAAGPSLQGEILAATDAGQLPAALVERTLRAGDVDDLVLLARAAAAVADPAQLPLLRTLAGRPEAAVRELAMLAAGRTGPAAAGLVRAGLADPDPAVRGAAGWAAAALGETLADPLLDRVAAETSAAALGRILPELWRLPEGAWEATAAAFLEHGDRDLRRAAAYALARTGGGAERAALRGTADDPDPWVRATALTGLGRGSATAADAPVLARGLADPDWRVATAAAGAIARQPTLALPEDAARRLRELVDSPHPHLQVAAIGALGAHPAVPAVDELAALAGGEEAWPAAEALLALARRGDAAAGALAVEWLDHPDAWRRRAAARTAGVLGTEDELLRRVLGGGSSLRLAWLETVEGATAEVVRPLLEDPDPVVRAAALDLLVRGDEAPPPAQLLAYARAWNADVLGDARAAALGAAIERGGVAERAAAIELAAADADPAARAVVLGRARALGLEAPPVERAPRHEPAWYDDLATWGDEARWLDLVTVRGTVRLRLAPQTAPITARTVWDLAEQGFYDGLTIHRVVPDFVVQGGDPRGDGWGGPGFVLPDEPSLVPFDAGTLGVATSGPNTGGSQLFVTLLPADHLTGRYTVLGSVVRGMEVLERLQVGDVIRAARVAAGAEPEPPPPVLLGRVSWQQLAEIPGWSEERAAYEPDAEAVAQLRQAAGDYRIVAVLGTWCSDSRREVPRLLEVMDRVGSERFAVELWAVDRTRRVAAPGFDESVLPGRTPDLVATIVVLDAATGVELGRVVETAERPLEHLLVEYLAPMEGWE